MSQKKTTLDRSFNRRTALKSLGSCLIGTTTLSGLSAASKRTDSAKFGQPLRTIIVDTERFGSLLDARATIYESGYVDRQVTGTNKPPEEGGDDHGYEIDVVDLWDSTGNIAPNKASIVLKESECGCTTTASDSTHAISGIGSKSSSNSDSQATDHSFTDEVSTMNNIDQSDSGWDYGGDYEGEVVAQCKNDARWVNLSQDVSWYTSNSSVDKYDWLLCSDERMDYSIDNQGQAESNFDGDNAYSKLYCDATYNGDFGDTYDVYLRVSHDMYPDGDTVWWGRVFTKNDGDDGDSPSANFNWGYYDDGADCGGENPD